jgi:hypothetical protein
MGPRFASAVVNDPDWTRGSAPEDYSLSSVQRIF